MLLPSTSDLPEARVLTPDAPGTELRQMIQKAVEIPCAEIDEPFVEEIGVNVRIISP